MRALWLALLLVTACDEPAPETITPDVEPPADETLPNDRTPPPPGSALPSSMVPRRVALRLEIAEGQSDGEHHSIVGTLTNVGATPEQVILPSDGSLAHLREPHLTWEAIAGGISLARRDTSGCGMYDERWWEQVITLAPGESRELEWVSNPYYDFERPAASTVTVRLDLEISGDHEVPPSATLPPGLARFFVRSNDLTIPATHFYEAPSEPADPDDVDG